MAYIWLGAFVFFLILEGITVQLVSIWLAVGSLAALGAYSLDVPVWGQIVVFGVVTLVCILFTRPLLRRFLAQQKIKTNADRYVGQTGIVVQDINNDAARGQVQVMGSIWTARAVGNAQIPEGEKVRVESIEGVKLLVSNLK